jgi:tetratricopeptide (TPR) repeat protein
LEDGENPKAGIIKRFMKKVITIFLFLLLLLRAYGQLWDVFYESFQAQRVDSIIQQIPNLSGHSLANAYVELAGLYRQFDFDRCIHFANMAIMIDEKTDDAAGQAFLYRGQAEYLKGDYIDAIKSLSQAREYLEKSGNRPHLAECYGSLALAFHYSEIKQGTGQELFARTLQIAIEEGYKRIEAYVYFMHGRFMMDSLKPDQALGYWEKAAEIFVEENHGTHHDKALSFILIGDYYANLKECRKAREICLKAHAWLDTSLVADCSILAQNYSMLGSCYAKSDQIDSALIFFNKGLFLSDKVGNAFSSAVNHRYLAFISLQLNDIPAAITHYKAALDHAAYVVENGQIYRDPAHWHLPGHPQEIAIQFPVAYRKHMNREMITAIHYRLYQIFLQQNDYQKALEHFQAYTLTNDTIQQLLRRKELQELGYLFETEHKDQRIMYLEQENELKEITVRQTRIIFLGTGLLMVLVIFMLILLLRQGKLKSRQETVQLEQKLLRSQMNPHFIFNSLASIQNKIVTEEPELATDYLARFAQLFRNILEGSTEEYIMLEKEIETVRNYLELQQVRFAGKFSYDVLVDEALDTERIRIPPMLTQPFIENAIEHGIKHKKGKGRIEIRIKRSGEQSNRRTVEQLNSRTVEQTIFEVEDDGVGREKAQELLHQRDKNTKAWPRPSPASGSPSSTAS